MQKEHMPKDATEMLLARVLMQRDTQALRAGKERMPKAASVRLLATIRMPRMREQRRQAMVLMLPDISLAPRASSHMSGMARMGRTMDEAVCCQAMEYTP